MKSKSLKDVVNYAKEKGLTPNSRILNLTHFDLDGAVCSINLKNYVTKAEDFFFMFKSYLNINKFFKDILLKDNCSFRDIDFVLVTDISIDEDIIQEFENRKETLIVLDHHETARHLNKYANCYIDETGDESGASVTLQFIKEMGFESTRLDKLNKITTEWDLFLFKKFPELRKFDIYGKKVSLAEMMNTFFFIIKPAESFVDRWFDGWESGFTKEEALAIKNEFKKAKDHIEMLNSSNLKVQLSDNKVLILSSKFIGEITDYYLDQEKNDILITYDPERLKFSGRSSDRSGINIGKIFSVLKKKLDYLETAGGHDKAGGGNLVSNDYLDDFIEKFVKLCEYYE